LLEELYGERGVLVYNLKKESEMLQNAKNNVNSMINNKPSEALNNNLGTRPVKI